MYKRQVKYLDGMEVQFGQVLEELRDVKEQLSQIQDGGVKASVLRIAEQAQGKVQEVGEMCIRDMFRSSCQCSAGSW